MKIVRIKRDRYLQKLISYIGNGQVKVITGIRRCGKSYLLNNIFRNYLIKNNVKKQNIIYYQLDLTKDLKYRNPIYLSSEVRKRVEGKKEKYFLFIDEIQMSDVVDNPYNKDGKKITFYDCLSDLRTLSNLDIYVTGSNSKMLSSDILTEFRGRSDEIRLHPLSFKEFYQTSKGDKNEKFIEYATFGGMPFLFSRTSDEEKIKYLTSLFKEVYLKDIIERKKILREDVLSSIVDLLSSSIGSLTNPNKIANSLNSKQKLVGENKVSNNTIKSYIDCLIDSFLFNECKRYDVKGKNYFDYPNKYYSEDLGLRNARSQFRELEMNVIVENIIYNELLIRDCLVDVGVVYSYQKDAKNRNIKVAREIDFIAYKNGNKTYIQSAFQISDETKKESEKAPLNLTRDSFPKIIIRSDVYKRFYDEDGVLNINIIDFLLDDTLI